MSKARKEYQALMIEHKKRQERNGRLLAKLDNIEKKAAFLQAKTDRIKSLKSIYRNHVERKPVKNVNVYSNVSNRIIAERVPIYIGPNTYDFNHYDPLQYSNYRYERIYNEPNPLYTLKPITLDDAIEEISKRFVLVPKDPKHINSYQYDKEKENKLDRQHDTYRNRDEFNKTKDKFRREFKNDKHENVKFDIPKDKSNSDDNEYTDVNELDYSEDETYMQDIKLKTKNKDRFLNENNDTVNKEGTEITTINKCNDLSFKDQKIEDLEDRNNVLGEQIKEVGYVIEKDTKEKGEENKTSIENKSERIGKENVTMDKEDLMQNQPVKIDDNVYSENLYKSERIGKENVTMDKEDVMQNQPVKIDDNVYSENYNEVSELEYIQTQNEQIEGNIQYYTENQEYIEQSNQGYTEQANQEYTEQMNQEYTEQTNQEYTEQTNQEYTEQTNQSDTKQMNQGYKEQMNQEYAEQISQDYVEGQEYPDQIAQYANQNYVEHDGQIYTDPNQQGYAEQFNQQYQQNSDFIDSNQISQERPEKTDLEHVQTTDQEYFDRTQQQYTEQIGEQNQQEYIEQTELYVEQSGQEYVQQIDPKYNNQDGIQQEYTDQVQQEFSEKQDQEYIEQSEQQYDNQNYVDPNAVQPEGQYVGDEQQYYDENLYNAGGSTNPSEQYYDETEQGYYNQQQVAQEYNENVIDPNYVQDQSEASGYEGTYTEENYYQQEEGSAVNMGQVKPLQVLESDTEHYASNVEETSKQESDFDFSVAQ